MQNPTTMPERPFDPNVAARLQARTDNRDLWGIEADVRELLRQDEAAGRVQAYLDERGTERHDVIATAGTRDERYSKPRLRGSDLREVLRELDEARQQIADLRAENEGLFFSYSTEKSRRDLASEAFDEVRGERDKLRDRVRALEYTAEPRCGAMGPPSLCGDEGRPLGPCELGPGHRNAYHRDSGGWWLDDPQPPAAGSLRHDEGAEPDLSNEPIGQIDV